MLITTLRRSVALALFGSAMLAAPAVLAQSVSKTVDLRLYEVRSLWTIEKTADASEVTLSCDQTVEVDYEVIVRKVGRTMDSFLGGSITVTNTAGGPLTLNDLDDIVQASSDPTIAVPLEVSCPVALPHVLNPGDVLVCTYDGYVNEPTETQVHNLNEAVATFAGGGTVSSGLIPYNLNFNGETDLCINVSDDLEGPLGVACMPVQEHTYQYTGTIGPFGATGVYDVINTASFYGVDSGPGGLPDPVPNPSGGSATGEASVTVRATVVCEGGGGCSRTIGYWKTHSSYGPATPADPVWMDLPGGLGPDTQFLNSGVTWHTLFWTPPAGGNHYINLAHQWMGASLNVLAGADATVLGTVLGDAEALMTANPTCRTNWRNCPAGVKTQMNAWAGFFDDYNNGDLPGGPEHCSDGSSNAHAGEAATTFALGTPAPNPTSGSSAIRIDVAEESQVVLVAYDLMGRVVARLADDYYQAGTYEVVFDGAGLPAGTYIIRMTAGEFHAVTRLVLAR